MAAECEDAHLVAIGLQEVEELKPRRQEGSQSRILKRRLLGALKDTHVCIRQAREQTMPLHRNIEAKADSAFKKTCARA